MKTNRQKQKPLHRSASATLRWWGLHAHLGQFLASADGLAILALLANATAKTVDDAERPQWYAHKRILLTAAVEAAPFAWSTPHYVGDWLMRLIVIETSFGQLAFHTSEHSELVATLPAAHGRRWAGGAMQANAYKIASAFLDYETHGEQYEGWIAQQQH